MNEGGYRGGDDGGKPGTPPRFDDFDGNSSVFDEVAKERIRQVEKWGVQDHHPVLWLGILGEEVGEINKGAIDEYFGHTTDKYANYREECIQVAAVAVAMVECLDRGAWKR